MTMPVSNAPAGPAMTKVGSDKPGSRNHGRDGDFSDLIRLPAHSRAQPQKPGAAAEPARLRLFQPVTGLEAAVGEASGRDGTDKARRADAANAGMPDIEIADEAGKSDVELTPETAGPDLHGEGESSGSSAKPMPIVAGAEQPQIAGGDRLRLNREPGGSSYASERSGNAGANETAASRSTTPSPANPMPEMPGAKFAAARPEIIHVTHPARQGDATISDIERALQGFGDDLRTAPASSGSDQARTGTSGRPGDWKGERVTVIAQHNIPAPAAQLSATTASALVSMLAGDPGWREAATPAFQPLAARPNLSSAHSLKIQLHPAELGMVTASLRLSGDHLTVELRVENQDAFHRLNADSEIIVKSMRALGLDIDKVTVQQPQLASQAQARADGPASSAAFTARGQDMSGQAGSGGGAGSSGHQSGRSGSDAAQGSGTAASNIADRAGGDIYI